MSQTNKKNLGVQLLVENVLGLATYDGQPKSLPNYDYLFGPFYNFVMHSMISYIHQDIKSDLWKTF